MTQGVWGGAALDIGPWAKDLTVPPDIPGGVTSTPIPVDDYWQTLLWYNSEIMKDDYVMGACLFVTGASGKAEWDTFEHLGPIMNRIEAFQEEMSIDAAASAATPTPPERPIEVISQPATTAETPPAATFDTAPAELELNIPVEAEAPAETTVPPVEIPAEPESSPALATSQWEVKIERGAGLALLVGDIGLANKEITIVRPNGRIDRVTSGSKGEYGKGGFEIYAQEAGTYKVEFLEQSFEISMSGQFTRVIFSEPE
jgi:hypothetical protein